jgi:hypothetical protein
MGGEASRFFLGGQSFSSDIKKPREARTDAQLISQHVVKGQCES